jgi:UDP-glucose 4-epimerase
MRYFNVYGPKQDPGSQYSGVISKFLAAALNGTPLNLYGDGTQTRDFVFVGDVARANVAALTSEAKGVFNIGTGSSVTLIELIKIIEDILGQKLDVQELPSRMGDIQKSEMSSSLMRNTLGISKTVSLRSGLLQLIEYIKQR